MRPSKLATVFSEALVILVTLGKPLLVQRQIDNNNLLLPSFFQGFV